MARYIDADKLLEVLNEELMYVGVMHTEEHEEYLKKGLRVAINDIKRLPTADVVPKSEVDSIKRYIIINEDIAIKCKQENGEENEEYWKGKISAFRQIRAYIDAELKKKYTEDQT